MQTTLSPSMIDDLLKAVNEFGDGYTYRKIDVLVHELINVGVHSRRLERRYCAIPDIMENPQDVNIYCLEALEIDGEVLSWSGLRGWDAIKQVQLAEACLTNGWEPFQFELKEEHTPVLRHLDSKDSPLSNHLRMIISQQQADEIDQETPAVKANGIKRRI